MNYHAWRSQSEVGEGGSFVEVRSCAVDFPSKLKVR